MNTKAELLAELENTDRRTRALLEGLSEEQLNVPYEPGINPPIWELGHAAFFYEVFILRALDGSDAQMPGYDEIWDSFEIQHKDRWQQGVVPEKETTFEYYQRIIDEVRQRIESRELDPQAHYLYKYAIFHQNMHIESLIWARQTLGYARPSEVEASAGTVGEGDVQVPAGRYRIGMPADSDQVATRDFAFDNEKPGFELHVEALSMSRALVCNRQFLDFVEDGGYENEACWSFGGTRWLKKSGATRPVYWRKHDDAWQLRHFDQWIELPLSAPVLHVSFWEAEAWCNWAGRRLPTEFEWEAAARGLEARHFPWGDDMDASRVDMDGGALGRLGTGELAEGASPFGCLQMLGTAWEWTSSQFLPYDGFTVDMYPYMSTLQFGDHKVTRGGSCATSSCLVRSTYRQAYFPDRNDVFTGFRSCAL